MIFDFLFKRGERAARAHQLVERGAALVDVRSPEEYAAGHLPGAINIPVGEIERRAAEIGAPNRAVVLYCRSGARSARAASRLVAMGFSEVLNLGPKSAW